MQLEIDSRNFGILSLLGKYTDGHDAVQKASLSLSMIARARVSSDVKSGPRDFSERNRHKSITRVAHQCGAFLRKDEREKKKSFI